MNSPGQDKCPQNLYITSLKITERCLSFYILGDILECAKNVMITGDVINGVSIITYYTWDYYTLWLYLRYWVGLPGGRFPNISLKILNN